MSNLVESNLIKLIPSRLTGGIYPAENKQQSASQLIRRLNLPQQVVLPLVSNTGAPLQPLVQVGDPVLTGQLVASCEQAYFANVHASISGTVTAIEMRPLAHSSGLSVPSLIIDSDGQDTPYPNSYLKDWRSTSQDQLLALIHQAGIVGLGGAAFPSSIKINSAHHQQPIQTLIANAAECEPYITADDALMQAYAYEILEGLALVQHLVQARQVLIGIEDNKPLAIQALHQALAQHPLAAITKICVVETRYPSGGEKQLIQLLTGQEVPSGQLPLSLGVLCHNVATLHAIYVAVSQGQPFIERLVTLTGQEVGQPGNYWVRLGTPLTDILAQVQANPAAQRLIVGGPMMGFSLNSANYHLSKNINCLLLPSLEELPLPKPEQPCIRCGQCELACPVQLLPQQLYFYSAHHNLEQAAEQKLFDCIECGACAWVCPSSIPLVQYFRYAKAEIKHEQANTQKAEQAKLRFEARNQRLAQEQAEREAKRQARAAAAAKMAALAQQKEAQQAASSKTINTVSAIPETAKTSKTAVAERTNPIPPTMQPMPAAQLKQLQIALAATKVAVQRAQKTLANLEADPDSTAEQIQQQQKLLAKAQEQFQKAENNLAAASSAKASVSESAIATTPATPVTPTAQPMPAAQLKQLQIALAATKVAVQRAQKTLANLEADPDSTATQIQQQQELLAKAQEQFEKAENNLAAARST